MSFISSKNALHVLQFIEGYSEQATNDKNRSTDPLSLCILTTSYPRHANDEAGIFIKRLVSALDDNEAFGSVVVPFDQGEPLQESQGNFLIHRFRYGLFCPGRVAFGSGIFPNIRSHPTRALQLPGLIILMARQAIKLRESYRTLHAHWILAGVSAWLSSLITNKPYILTLRGEDVKVIKIWWLKPIFRFCFQRAKTITCVNEHFVQQVLDQYKLSPKKVHHIPNGVSVRRVTEEELLAFCNREGLPRNAKYALFVGRIIPLKQVERLIDLISHPELSDFRLLLCGATDDQNYLQQLLERTREKNCENRIFIKGSVAPDEVPLYLALSSVYLSASSYEGRSNSVLEALAAGKVVFASAIQGHREIIVNENNGFLFEPEDVDTTASRISKVISDSDFMDKISVAARMSVEHLSWKNAAKRYCHLFAEHK